MTPGIPPTSTFSPSPTASSRQQQQPPRDGREYNNNNDTDVSVNIDVASWRPHRPNLLLTGTPGVGKTTLACMLCAHLGLRHIDVGVFARDRNLFATYDDTRNAHTMHEDAVLDELEPLLLTGAVLLDHHSVDWFPERWPQLVVCLSASTEALYDRLTERGYRQPKVMENLQAEIMQVIYEEAVQAYPSLNVMRLRNDTEADMQNNFNAIKAAWNEIVCPLGHPDRNNRVDGDLTQ